MTDSDTEEIKMRLKDIQEEIEQGEFPNQNQALRTVLGEFIPSSFNTGPEFESGDIFATASSTSQTTYVSCPECGRKEEFDRHQLAHAWLFGHIIEEHSGALPPLAGEPDD